MSFLFLQKSEFIILFKRGYLMYKAFHFGLLTSLTGILTYYIYFLATEIVRFSMGITDEKIYFTKSLSIIPITLLVIGLPFVIIIPLIWLSRWGKK